MGRNSTSHNLQQIGGTYTVGRKLGSGSFGSIYLAINDSTGEMFAAKVESSKGKNSMLAYEARLLKQLHGQHGIATMRHCGMEDGHYVMVMDLLGPSLEDLFAARGRQLGVRTILMMADQILYRIEYLHSNGYIHRDIKPQNFLIGRGSGTDNSTNTIFLIDFGLAKRFRNPQTKQHIPFREGKNLTGTARYVSVNTHIGFEQSRRDDLEAVGYLLIYFLRGDLPWQGIQAGTKEEKYAKIKECKQQTSVEQLCKGCPAVFATYLNYCKSLRFQDRPDYAYLRRLFKDLFMRENFTHYGRFDWFQPAEGNEVENQPSEGGTELRALDRKTGFSAEAGTCVEVSTHNYGEAEEHSVCHTPSTQMFGTVVKHISSGSTRGVMAHISSSSTNQHPESPACNGVTSSGREVGDPSKKRASQTSQEKTQNFGAMLASLFSCGSTNAVRQ